MESKYIRFKKTAIQLRLKGFSYTEINNALDCSIPKSTLSTWFSKSLTSEKLKATILQTNKNKGIRSALLTKRKNREAHLNDIYNKISYLEKVLENKDVAKISLAVLYLGEGAKRKSSLMFGNSNPEIIRLFLKLLRFCYEIDDNKFRCTVQCRADQNVKELENYWSEITKISPNKFYRAQVDKRTIGKQTKNNNYKGVCRIDYFSSAILNEIVKISEAICKSGI